MSSGSKTKKIAIKPSPTEKLLKRVGKINGLAALKKKFERWSANESDASNKATLTQLFDHAQEAEKHRGAIVGLLSALFETGYALPKAKPATSKKVPFVPGALVWIKPKHANKYVGLIPKNAELKYSETSASGKFVTLTFADTTIVIPKTHVRTKPPKAA